MTSPYGLAATAHRREHWADNLRVVLIAGVIVAHTATAYVVDIPWYYDDEQDASGAWAVILGFPAFAGGVFGLGPLFLVAGWFSALSLTRRGPVAFVRSRLLRLGVPLLIFVLLVQPLTDYIGNLRSERGSFLYYLGMTEVSVMWFVAALLVFSLVYVVLRRLRHSPEPRPPGPAGPLILAAVVTIAVSSFAVWQVWPWNAEVFLNLRLGEWPQAAVLFALGVHLAETGRLRNASWALFRRLGLLAAFGALALAALFGAEVAWGDVDTLLNATSPGPVIIFAVLDGVVAVTWTLWCVAWFRRRWSGHGTVLDRAGRASYATYFIHPLVLTAMMVAFAAVPLPPVLKFVVISVLGVPACFTAGYAFTRVPVFRRVF